MHDPENKSTSEDATTTLGKEMTGETDENNPDNNTHSHSSNQQSPSEAPQDQDASTKPSSPTSSEMDTQKQDDDTDDVAMEDADADEDGGDDGSSKPSNAGEPANGNGADAPSAAADASTNNKNTDAAGAAGTAGTTSTGNANSTATSKDQPASASPPPPVLKGTLSYNVELRRHLIRGMWNYESSSAFRPQRFELLRNLDPTEDPKELPKDGEFHGSFSLAYFHTTSKGKQKERSKVIPESGVNIKFTKVEDDAQGTYKVDGTGTNQFGIFHINGTATPSPHDDGQYNIVLRKRYEPSSQPPAAAPEADAVKKTKKRKMPTPVEEAPVSEENLPPPSESYEKNVVCLRGNLNKEQSEDLGSTEVTHRIQGMWSSGLDLIQADPQNTRGLCNRFEYEHKTSVTNATTPVSGRFSGWFDLNMEDGSKKKIVEKDVTLRFKKNNAGYYNVEGRGSNAFGKYSITGSLTLDNVITIFRHFQVKKTKTPSRPVTSPPPPINAPGQTRKPSLPSTPDPQLKMDEVQVPAGEEPFEPLVPPDNATYSAVSRGVLRLNDDGSLSCQGKWAVTREHFTNGQTSNFTFRLESHFAAEALKNAGERGFPLDSEMYKGSFQLKKGGTRYQTVIDQQIVMKFRKNTSGSYNVYGKGVNAIGVFNLLGTLIMSGATAGQVDVYRMYPPELLSAPVPVKTPSTTITAGASVASEAADTLSVASNAPPMPGKGGFTRRESTRPVKVPTRLEDGDPAAQLNRIMDKCNSILRFIREKDVERGAFFSEPVDPVALGIPTYHQVIHEPMDLRTLARKMEAKEVSSPEEFARLARLVFENAMTFNVDPTHSVHQAARNLLILFNQKFRDVERMATNLRRAQNGDDTKKKAKDDKKRKRVDDTRSLKRRRLDEAQEMAASNASAMAALAGAVPRDPNASVTRNEFSLLLQMITQLQQQMVQTHTALAELSSDEPGSGAVQPTPEAATSAAAVVPEPVAVAAPDRKKPKKKPEPKPVEKPAVVEVDSRPLTLKEQELLTETINDLPHEHLHGVIQIIREAAKISGEEEEIDLEIDQLDAVTQRKLLRHVSKFIKQPKRSKAKAPKKKAPAPAAPAPSEPPAKKAAAPTPAPAPAAKKTDSFFSFGGQDDSDSDSEGEITSPTPAATEDTGAKSFSLGDGFGGGNAEDSDNGDDDGDVSHAGAAAWTIAQPTTSEKHDADEDDGWAGAREAAAIAKAKEEDKKKREEKMQAEAEQLKNQRLADAVAHGEELKAQRQAEELEEARLKEQQDKEAEEQRKKAREQVLAQAQSVEQTVDLDSQRDMMKQFEQSFMEKEMGGASPSSDFGF
eukprot:Nitzschia sp. Nitz4//scaffold9_size221794//189005//193052//NITZ4_001378-RA/size221794-snap-gene-0.194-mRNA-1//-1//CDS//3329561097//4405//frame0